MKESDTNNKKARIDEDVTIAILMNLSEAYIWLNDYTKSQEDLTKLDGFKLTFRRKNIRAIIHAFHTEQSSRFLANKTN